MSSYIMNASGAFSPPSNDNGLYGYKTAKISRIWSPECWLMWEPDPKATAGGIWNDGSNYPATEGLGLAHQTGALIQRLDGGAMFVKTNAYFKEVSNPLPGVPGKGLLRWNPNTIDGY